MNSAMKKKANYIFGLGVVFMMFFVNDTFSGMECQGTQYNGVYYEKGQHYYPIKNGVKYDCEACGICKPMSNSFGSSAMPYGAGMSPAQQMAAILIENALKMPSGNGVDIQQQQEALQKAQQEAEKEARAQKVGRMQQLNASAAKNNSDDMVRLLGGNSSGSPDHHKISKGLLEPLKGPVSEETGDTGTSKQPQFQQLLCAAYFSRLAEEAARSGDEDKARFMGKQAEIVMSGGTPEIGCQYPPAPDVPVPEGKEPAAETGVIAMVQRDIQGLRDIDARLQAISRQKKQTLNEKNRLEKEIAAMETAASAQKANDDGLLIQKKKDLEETEKDLATLETDRRQLISRQNGIKNQLTRTRDDIQAGLSD